MNYFSDKSSLNKALTIALPVACGAILLILVLAFYFRCYRKQRGEHVFRRDFVNMSEVSLVRTNTILSYFILVILKDKYVKHFVYTVYNRILN